MAIQAKGRAGNEPRKAAEAEQIENEQRLTTQREEAQKILARQGVVLKGYGRLGEELVYGVRDGGEDCQVRLRWSGQAWCSCVTYARFGSCPHTEEVAQFSAHSG